MLVNKKTVSKSRDARVTNPVTNQVKKTAKGNDLRSFVLVSVNGQTPDYNQVFSTTPSASASKHFSSWCRKNKKGKNTKAVVEIRESTRGSLQKKFTYNCVREKLSKTDEIDRNGKVIKYNFKSVCKAKKD